MALITLTFALVVSAMSPQSEGGSKPELSGANSPAEENKDVSQEEVAEEEESETPKEMEEFRAMEELEVPADIPTQAQVQSLIERLGAGNPLRHHLTYALDDIDPRASFLTESPVALITDIAGFDVNRVKSKYDIPVEMHPMVEKYIQFFLGRGRQWFSKWMSRSTRYIPLFQPILAQYGLPKDTVYLSMIESGFSPQAYSWASASGPWQFIASTGKLYQLKQDFWVDERRDPIKSTHAASRFLMHLYQDLGHWHLAWAGYNTGGARVRRVINKKGTKDFWTLTEGRGLAKETKHYVPKLIAAALVAKHYREFGFKDEEFEYLEPFAFEEVKVDAATELEVLAAAAGTTVEMIHELNPELKRWCSPPASAEAPYTLRVPPGTAKTFQENYAQLDATKKLNFVVHRIARGDTLSKIALKYKSLTEVIMRLNGLQTPKTLKVGTELAIPLPHPQAVAQFEAQAQQARKAGFIAPKPEEEIPAGVMKKAARGSVRKEKVDGKERITYGVAPGDSLWIISQRFGCSMEELMRWNGLTKRSKLQIGMPIAIWGKQAPSKVSSNKP